MRDNLLFQSQHSLTRYYTVLLLLVFVSHSLFLQSLLQGKIEYEMKYGKLGRSVDRSAFISLSV